MPVRDQVLILAADKLPRQAIAITLYPPVKSRLLCEPVQFVPRKVALAPVLIGQRHHTARYIIFHPPRQPALRGTERLSPAVELRFSPAPVRPRHRDKVACVVIVIAGFTVLAVPDRR